MSRIILIVAFLLLPKLALAVAPTFDAVTTSTILLASSISANHTVGGGCSNPYLTAFVTGTWPLDVQTISSVSTTAGAMTNLATQNDMGGSYSGAVYGRAGPTGAQTVTVTFSGTVTEAILIVRSDCGVDQSTSTGTPTTGANAGTSSSISVASSSGETVIDFVSANTNTSGTLTVGSGQTQRANLADGNDFQEAGSSDEAGAASVSMDWSWTPSSYWIAIGMSLKPIASAPGAAFVRKPMSW